MLIFLQGINNVTSFKLSIFDIDDLDDVNEHICISATMANNPIASFAVATAITASDAVASGSVAISNREKVNVYIIYTHIQNLYLCW